MSDPRGSGAQRRKAAKLAKAERLASELGGADDFDALPPLDTILEDPDLALEYGRRALLISLDQICHSRNLPTLERWRLIKDFTATLGMTHNRAAIESRTKKLEGALRERKANAGVVKVESGKTVKRPATARGSAPPGPRALPDDASVTPAPDAPAETDDGGEPTE